MKRVDDFRLRFGKNEYVPIMVGGMGVDISTSDLALEAAFWAQLPGNFAHRPRKAPITSRNFAAMVSFHNYPCGRASGNHWGDALALLMTSSRSPYYFSLHATDPTDLSGEDASHESLRDDYGVSSPQLDAVVEIARSVGRRGGVYGCRMTGGGFGGCAMALITTRKAAAITSEIGTEYRRRTGLAATMFLSRPAAGAQLSYE